MKKPTTPLSAILMMGGGMIAFVAQAFYAFAIRGSFLDFGILAVPTLGFAMAYGLLLGRQYGRIEALRQSTSSTATETSHSIPQPWTDTPSANLEQHVPGIEAPSRPPSHLNTGTDRPLPLPPLPPLDQPVSLPASPVTRRATPDAKSTLRISSGERSPQTMVAGSFPAPGSIPSAPPSIPPVLERRLVLNERSRLGLADALRTIKDSISASPQFGNDPVVRMRMSIIEELLATHMASLSISELRDVLVPKYGSRFDNAAFMHAIDIVHRILRQLDGNLSLNTPASQATSARPPGGTMMGGLHAPHQVLEFPPAHRTLILKTCAAQYYTGGGFDSGERNALQNQMINALAVALGSRSPHRMSMPECRQHLQSLADIRFDEHVFSQAFNELRGLLQELADRRPALPSPAPSIQGQQPLVIGQNG